LKMHRRHMLTQYFIAARILPIPPWGRGASRHGHPSRVGSFSRQRKGRIHALTITKMA
jgi:hypothetical protein